MIGLDSALGIQPTFCPCPFESNWNPAKKAAFIIFLMVLRTRFPIVSKKGNTVPKF